MHYPYTVDPATLSSLPGKLTIVVDADKVCISSATEVKEQRPPCTANVHDQRFFVFREPRHATAQEPLSLAWNITRAD
jgi:hypothetical protein